MSLLVVDSDARSLRVLEVSLKKAGFDVAAAQSAEEALELARNAPPELVITETKLPGQTGFSLCQALRRDPKTAGTAVLFLSEDSSADSRIKAISAGADDYVAKPLLVKEIVLHIRTLLERREREAFGRADGSSNLTGNLAGLGLVDIFQLVETGRKSCILRIASNAETSGGFASKEGQTARIFFRNGAAIDAEVGSVVGEDAVYRLLLWNDGRFELEFTEVDNAAVIELSHQVLLLEGMRRVDEWTRLQPRLPPLSALIAVDYQAMGKSGDVLPEEVEEILHLCDGKRTILEVLNDGTLTDLDALSIVARLLEDKIVFDPASRRSKIPRAQTSLENWLSHKPAPAATSPVPLTSATAGIRSPSTDRASALVGRMPSPDTQLPIPIPEDGSILTRQTITSSEPGPIPLTRRNDGRDEPILLTQHPPREAPLIVRRVTSVAPPPRRPDPVVAPHEPAPLPKPEAAHNPAVSARAAAISEPASDTAHTQKVPVAAIRAASAPGRFSAAPSHPAAPAAAPPPVWPRSNAVDGDSIVAQAISDSVPVASARAALASGGTQDSGLRRVDATNPDLRGFFDSRSEASGLLELEAGPKEDRRVRLVLTAMVGAAVVAWFALLASYGDDKETPPTPIRIGPGELALTAPKAKPRPTVVIPEEDEDPPRALTELPRELPIEPPLLALPPPPIAPAAPQVVSTAALPTAATPGPPVVAESPPAPVNASKPAPNALTTTPPQRPRADPGAVAEHIASGSRHLQKEAFGPSRDAFQKAVQLDPASGPAHAGLALSLYNLGKVGAARREAHKALKLDADAALAHLVIGFIATEAGNQTQATASYKKYLQLEPQGQYASEIRSFLRQ